ncbi:MAG: smalltalk protein [Bacteroides sp.]|nr:smalltalk protein [Bacteroides sp.]
MATKASLWDKILKIVIAVASAVLGALGTKTMNVVNG